MTDPVLRNKIALNIQAHMQVRGWTQSKLVDALDSNSARISLMVRGVKLPTIEMLVKVAQLFGVTVDDLLKDPVRKNLTNVA
jgi:transcriptional regulator with XRE-family HTH domain